MGLNQHEQAVRAAVDKTKAESVLATARFRVERAQRALDKWKADGQKFRDELDAATHALDGARAGVSAVKKAAAPVAPQKPCMCEDPSDKGTTHCKDKPCFTTPAPETALPPIIPTEDL